MIDIPDLKGQVPPKAPPPEPAKKLGEANEQKRHDLFDPLRRPGS